MACNSTIKSSRSISKSSMTASCASFLSSGEQLIFLPLLWRSFPFYSRRRLAGDIVDYSVYAGNFINHTVRYCSEKVMGQTSPIRSHSIFTGYCSNSYQVTISSIVAHDPDALDISEYSKALPKLAIKLGF